MNDGSTDDSAVILEEYASKYARIKVFHQKNAGLSAARNTALEQASGEWVTGVDSDDYLNPVVYEQVMSDITDDVDMAFFGVAKVDENGAILPFSVYFELPAAGVYEMNPALASSLNVCFVSKLWRRSMLEKHSLRFPDGLIHEDEALFYLAAPYVRNVAVSSVVGYNYVQRMGSIMHPEISSDLYRIQRFLPVLEYTGREYTRRGWMRRPERLYLVKMFVRLSCQCVNIYWSKEKTAIVALLKPLMLRFGVWRDDYRLERLLPVCWWLRLFLSRHESSRVYRIFGVAIWAVLFTKEGVRSGHCCLIWKRVKKLLLK